MTTFTVSGIREALERLAKQGGHPMLPIVHMTQASFECACDRFCIDKYAAIAEGMKYNVDAVIGGYGIVFAKPMPQRGVVWKGTT